MMFKEFCKEINWNEKEDLGKGVLRTSEKISPPRIFSIYFGGINLAHDHLPHGFVLQVYDLRKPSLLFPFASVQTTTKGQAGSRILSKGRTGKLAVFPLIPPFKRRIPSAITQPSA